MALADAGIVALHKEFGPDDGPIPETDGAGRGKRIGFQEGLLFHRGEISADIKIAGDDGGHGRGQFRMILSRSKVSEIGNRDIDPLNGGRIDVDVDPRKSIAGKSQKGKNKPGAQQPTARSILPGP